MMQTWKTTRGGLHNSPRACQPRLEGQREVMHSVAIHRRETPHYLAVHLRHGRFPRAPSASTRRVSPGVRVPSPGGRGRRSSICARWIRVRFHREEASGLRQCARRPRSEMRGRRSDPGDAEKQQQQQADGRAGRRLQCGRPPHRHVCVCLELWIRPSGSFYR